MARRAAKEAEDQPYLPAASQPKVELRKFVKIGRPGYKVTRERDPQTGQQALLFQVDYPEIAEGITPRLVFSSSIWRLLGDFFSFHVFKDNYR